MYSFAKKCVNSTHFTLIDTYIDSIFYFLAATGKESEIDNDIYNLKCILGLKSINWFLTGIEYCDVKIRIQKLTPCRQKFLLTRFSS